MRPFTSTFMLSGMRLSSSVSLNSDSIISSASTERDARLDDQPDIFGRFIAHVGDQRQLLLVDQFGESFRPGATSAPAREFRVMTIT